MIEVDQSDWKHIAVYGSDRARFLNGLVTGNVKTMKPGDWMRTLMLNHKARLLSMFDLQAFDDHFRVSCEPSLSEKTFEILDKYIVMDDVELEEVKGLKMHSIWKSLDDVWNAAPVFHETKNGASLALINQWRVEAGMPKLGVDVTESNFPFESLLTQYLDYEKGCFTGQEPVARVYARGGGGSKQLCGLQALGNGILATGAPVVSIQNKGVGNVTSTVLSETLGSIALAYVHKSAWEPGSIVKVGDLEAKVCTLPFEIHL